MYDKLGDLLNEAMENENLPHSEQTESEKDSIIAQAFELLECSAEMSFEQIKAKYYMLVNSKKNSPISSDAALVFRNELLKEYEDAFSVLSEYYSLK